MKKTKKEWKKILTKEQYNILRKKRTESPFTGKYVDFNKEGEYSCVACGNKLFDSKTKFNSHCGWPSFYDTEKDAVEFRKDNSLGMERMEVICKKCKSHLGHIFNDAPQTPTGQRFCINSVVLKFKKK